MGMYILSKKGGLLGPVRVTPIGDAKWEPLAKPESTDKTAVICGNAGLV